MADLENYKKELKVKINMVESVYCLITFYC